MENFIQLKHNSIRKQQLLDFAKSRSTSWVNKNAFDIASVPTHLLDPVLLKLKLKFFGKPVIFRMQPWQFYRFHIDEARSCAINLFLEGSDSHTYYGTDTEDEEIMNITELVYDVDCYYILNTKAKHAVVNRNNVRYMFSLGIDQKFSYEEVAKFCLDNNL